MTERLLLFLLLLLFLGRSQASQADPLLFDKESGLDTLFPPVIPRRAEDEVVPTGHLRSLGHQAYPEAQVEELEKQPSPAELHARIANNTPFAFLEAGQTEGAVFSLTDEDLDREFGAENIHYVPIPRHRSVEEVVEPDTLSSFLKTYKKRDEYLATTMPERMRHLFPVPFALQCGPYTRRLLEAELWMAWGGTGTFMHYHGDHQLHCMIDGRKDFIFVHPKHKDKLKCQETRPNSGEGISTINMDMINMFEDGVIAEVPWSFTTAIRGHCVFIPAGYLHHVRSFGRALSYKIHFAVSNDKDAVDAATACGKTVPKASRSLKDYDFVWTMKNGVEQLSNEQLTAADLVAILQLVARGKDRLSKEQFVAFYDRAMQKAKSHTTRSYPTGEKVFSFLDKKKTRAIRISNLKLMESRLKQIAKVLNKIHVPEHTEL